MIPYTVDQRADTGVTNVTLGIWLFLASEVMLFGALFSAYALLRVSAPAWPSGRDVLDLTPALVNTGLLVVSSGLIWRAARATPVPIGRIAISTLLALAFLVFKTLEYRDDIARGLLPETSTFLALYFTLTGVHALHVAGGATANVWVMAGRRSDGRVTAGRARALALYWLFVDAIWVAIFTLFYL
jgi:heme/copper-type cytochrome/quinol oxidase subunit 3